MLSGSSIFKTVGTLVPKRLSNGHLRDRANVICSPRRPALSQAIRGVLGKFADLPQEAEEEIRGLDEARRRNRSTGGEIKRLRGRNADRQPPRLPPLSDVAVRRIPAPSQGGPPQSPKSLCR